MDGRTEQQREAERWTAEAQAQAQIATSLATQAEERARGRTRADQLAEMAAMASELAYEAHIRVEKITADPDGTVIWAPAVRNRAYDASARAHEASEDAARWASAADAHEAEWSAVLAARAGWSALNAVDGKRVQQASFDAGTHAAAVREHVRDALDGTSNEHPVVRFLGLVQLRADAAERSAHEANARAMRNREAHERTIDADRERIVNEYTQARSARFTDEQVDHMDEDEAVRLFDVDGDAECGSLLPAGTDALVAMLDEEQADRPAEEWRRRYAAQERYDMLEHARDFLAEDPNTRFDQLVVELGFEVDEDKPYLTRAGQNALDWLTDQVEGTISDNRDFLLALANDVGGINAAMREIAGVITQAYAGDEMDEDEPACPCGSDEVYVTSYCNFAHCVACGAAVDPEHEASGCWVLPEALALEQAGWTREAHMVARSVR